MAADRCELVWRITATGVIIAAHVTSFFLPVFVFKDSSTAGFHNPVYGLEVLMYGFMGLYQGALGWYANPLFWLGVVRLARGRFRVSAGLGLAGTLLALT